MLLREFRRNNRDSLQAMAERGELQNVNLDCLAADLVGAFWASFLLWNKGLVSLAQLEPTMLRKCLGVLIPCTQGAVHEELQGVYDAQDWAS